MLLTHANSLRFVLHPQLQVNVISLRQFLVILGDFQVLHIEQNYFVGILFESISVEYSKAKFLKIIEMSSVFYEKPSRLFFGAPSGIGGETILLVLCVRTELKLQCQHSWWNRLSSVYWKPVKTKCTFCTHYGSIRKQYGTEQHLVNCVKRQYIPQSGGVPSQPEADLCVLHASFHAKDIYPGTIRPPFQIQPVPDEFAGWKLPFWLLSHDHDRVDG